MSAYDAAATHEIESLAKPVRRVRRRQGHAVQHAQARWAATRTDAVDAVRRNMGTSRDRPRSRLGAVAAAVEGSMFHLLAVLQNEQQTLHEPPHESHDRLAIAERGIVAALGQALDMFRDEALLEARQPREKLGVVSGAIRKEGANRNPLYSRYTP